MDKYGNNIFWDRMNDRAIETINAIKKGKTPQIIRYAVHITSACNMRCVYCKENKSVPKIMDRNLFVDICKKAGKKGVVHITGGEPMIVPWIEDEIVNNRDITRFALNTNLSIRPKDETLRSIFRVKTSLDDYNGERWNRVVGGNYFNKVVKNIKYCSEIVKYLSVSFTATHKNAYRLSNFIKFCNDNFPKLYSTSVSFYKGINKDLILTPEDIEGMFFSADAEMNKVSYQLFCETHTLKGNDFPQNLKIPCYLSQTERLIDENGMEYYCSHLYRDKVCAPGNPGLDPNCVTGCNARFAKYNKMIHEKLGK
jgi:MoaA/NifB/PqqE/SkfB family radical SAM enzyme